MSKKPNLMALPRPERPPQTRTLTDPENQPDVEFPLTLRPPGRIERGNITKVALALIEAHVTGKKDEKGKLTEEATLYPSVDGQPYRLDEELWWRVAIIEGLQPADAPVRYDVGELLILMDRAPEAWGELEEWAMVLWSKPARGNSDAAPATS